MAKRARCPVCHALMFYNKHTGQFIRHRDPGATDGRLCAGSHMTTPVPNTVKAKAKQRANGKPKRAVAQPQAAEPDPRQRCSYCFKLLVPRADGCFRVHTVGSGVRCEGSGRRPSDTPIRPTKARRPVSPDSADDKEFADLSFRELREVAAVAAELEAEQRAETVAIRRMNTEAEERQQLKALVRSIIGSEDSPEEIKRRLRAETVKWRRRGLYWQERIAVLEERYAADPESWEVELDAAREAMGRCTASCSLIDSKIAAMTPQPAPPRPGPRPEGAAPRDTPAPSRSTAERLWSAIQRLWK